LKITHLPVIPLVGMMTLCEWYCPVSSHSYSHCIRGFQHNISDRASAAPSWCSSRISRGAKVFYMIAGIDLGKNW